MHASRLLAQIFVVELDVDKARKDGCNEYACNAGRHLAHHEERENCVGLSHCYIQFRRVGLVESVETCSNHVEGY